MMTDERDKVVMWFEAECKRRGVGVMELLDQIIADNLAPDGDTESDVGGAGDVRSRESGASLASAPPASGPERDPRDFGWDDWKRGNADPPDGDVPVADRTVSPQANSSHGDGYPVPSDLCTCGHQRLSHYRMTSRCRERDLRFGGRCLCTGFTFDIDTIVEEAELTKDHEDVLHSALVNTTHYLESVRFTSPSHYAAWQRARAVLCLPIVDEKADWSNRPADTHSRDWPQRRILWNDAERTEIDEFVVMNPKSVHVEQMGDDCWWMCVTLPDGRDFHVNFYAVSKKRMTLKQQSCEWEWDEDITHEDGRTRCSASAGQTEVQE